MRFGETFARIPCGSQPAVLHYVTVDRIGMQGLYVHVSYTRAIFKVISLNITPGSSHAMLRWHVLLWFEQHRLL